MLFCCSHLAGVFTPFGYIHKSRSQDVSWHLSVEAFAALECQLFKLKFNLTQCLFNRHQRVMSSNLTFYFLTFIECNHVLKDNIPVEIQSPSKSYLATISKPLNTFHFSLFALWIPLLNTIILHQFGLKRLMSSYRMRFLPSQILTPALTK